MNGPVKVTERSPDKYVEAIKDLFLDFDAKYPSAPSLIPASTHYDKECLQHSLTPIFETLKEAIQIKELTDTCIAPEFPHMGSLTRLEWIAVAIYHTKRHTHQINDIKAAMAPVDGIR
jgi:hypothetical protein